MPALEDGWKNTDEHGVELCLKCGCTGWSPKSTDREAVAGSLGSCGCSCLKLSAALLFSILALFLVSVQLFVNAGCDPKNDAGGEWGWVECMRLRRVEARLRARARPLGVRRAAHALRQSLLRPGPSSRPE